MSDDESNHAAEYALDPDLGLLGRAPLAQLGHFRALGQPLLLDRATRVVSTSTLSGQANQVLFVLAVCAIAIGRSTRVRFLLRLGFALHALRSAK